MEKLKESIYRLYEPDYKISLFEYNKLIEQCIQKRELAAVVFLYEIE